MGRGAEDQRARGTQPRQSQEEGQSGTPSQTPPGPAASPLGSSRDRPGPGSLVPYKDSLSFYIISHRIAWY